MISVGIRPQVALARAHGLEVNRGIVVDDTLATSHPQRARRRRVRGAPRDRARHRRADPRAGAVAAATLAAASAYTGSIPTAKLKVMGVDLVCAGNPDGARAVVRRPTSARYRKLAVDGDGPHGRRDPARRHARRRAAAGRGAHRHARRATRSALLAEASQATAADLPDSARVCNCHGVCKGEIVDAIRTRGLGSTLEVVYVTRAGAGCGSCKPLVGELLAIERGGAAEEATYLCPCRRQTREELAAVVRERGLESVSAS